MKRILSIISALTVLLTSVMISATADNKTVQTKDADTPLLCSDPGFESGSFDKTFPKVDNYIGQWNKGQFSDCPDAGMYITDETAYSGMHSLKIQAATWSTPYAGLGFRVERNTVYQLSFKYKLGNSTGDRFINAVPLTKTGSGYELNWDNMLTERSVFTDTRAGTADANGWRSAWLIFDTGDSYAENDTDPMIQVLFGTRDSDSGNYLQANDLIYLDDVYLEKVTDAENVPLIGNDPGFETALESYVPAMGKAATGNGIVSRSAEEPHSGSYALKYAPTTWDARAGLAAFNVCADTDYILSFWCKGADQWAQYSIYEAVPTGWKDIKWNEGETDVEHQFFIPATQDKSEWLRVEVPFHAKKTGTIQLCFNGVNPDYPFYLDDISLKKGVSKNLFKYGSFETHGGWTPDGGYFPRISTDEAHSGNSSYHITPGWDYCATTSDSFAVKPNTDYIVTMFYKGAPAWASIKLNNGTSDITEKNFGGETPTEWTQFTHSFNSGNATSMQLKIMIYAGSDFYVDDIYIMEAGSDLILNGDFELGDLFWEYDSDYHAVMNTEDAGDTVEAMHLKNGNNSIVSQKVTLSENKNYELSFRYKGTLQDGITGWSVSDKKATFSKGSLKAFGSLNTADEWTTAGGVFTADKSGDYYVNFQSVALCDYYITDISLKETDKPADSYALGDDAEYITNVWRDEEWRAYKYLPQDGKNIIENGGFEADAGQWSNSAFLIDGMCVSTDSSAVHTGNRGIEFKAIGTKTASFLLEVEPNAEDYLFGVWVKGNAFTKDNINRCSFGITVPDTGEYIEERYVPAYDGEWHLAEYSFKSNSLSKVTFTITATDTTVYLDDIFLCKMSDAEKYVTPAMAMEQATVTAENPTLLGCEDSKNLFRNFDFETDGFWDEVDGNLYGKQLKIVDSESSIYGNALHYNAVRRAKSVSNRTGAYYIKYIAVEPHTNYTFSGKYSLVNPSSNIGFTNSYFGFIDGNPLLPSVIVDFALDASAYLNNHAWQTASVSFNTGDYDKIGFIVYDGGGEAYFDDLRLFKTTDAKPLAERADHFPASKLESSTYMVNNGVIRISGTLTVGKLIDAFRYNQYVKLYDKDGNSVSDRNAAVATGMELRLADGPEIKDRASVVIVGDIDSDGKIDSADTERLLSYLSGAAELNDLERSAADFDGNGTLNLYDAMRNSDKYRTEMSAKAELTGPQELTVGGEFELELTVPAGMFGFSAELKYDPEKLIFNDAQLNLGGEWKISVNAQNGVIKIFAADSAKQNKTIGSPVVTFTFFVASTVREGDVIEVNATNLNFTDGKVLFEAADLKWPVNEEAKTENSTSSETGNTTETVVIKNSGPSNNNLLASLEMEGVTFTPDFTPENKVYEAEVPFEVKSVKVYATAQNEKATITIEGTDLSYVGKNIVRVVVLSESGLKRTYRITVTRKDQIKTNATADFDDWWIIIVAAAVVIAVGAVITVILVKKHRKTKADK